jgi:hypothetical protein
MTGLRRLAAPLRLAAARLGRRVSAALLTGLGVAAGAAMVAAVLAGSLIAQDRSVGFATQELPASQQAVRAVWFGVPGQSSESRRELDQRAREALAGITAREATALALFRESTIAGRYVGLGAVDDLARWVDLSSGRLPSRCRPERCEVVRLRGEGLIPNAPGLRLVEVGKATLRTPVLFGDFIAPVTSGRTRASLSPFLQEAARYHQPAPAPLVLAEGVDGLVSSPRLDSAYRSYSWVVPLGPGTVRAWQVDRFPGDVSRARSSLQAESIAFDLLAPVEELREAGDASRAAGRRLLLIGGEAAALLFAFAVLAAASMRRDVEAARRRLTWYGARSWQLWALVGAETATTAIVGTAAGWALGVAASALVASRAGVPVGEVLAHSALSETGLLVAGGIAVALALVLVAALRMQATDVGGLSVSPLDVAALGALGVVMTILVRGDFDEATLSRTEGTAATLVLLPGLITFVAAVFFARLFRPVLVGLARCARGRAVSLRLAAVSLARHPGYAAVAIAFLVVSVGLALFAESYRTTLAEGQTQQAAYAVPLDFVVQEDLTRLVPVPEATGGEGFAALGEGVRAEPVLRLAGNVSRSGGRTGITVLGLDPGVLPDLHGWRESFAAVGRTELARRMADGAGGEPAGPVLPTGAKTLVLRAQGRGISLVASVENPGGDFEHLELGEPESGRASLLRARIPHRARGGRVVALTLVPPRIQERGADAGKPFRGTLTLGPLAVETVGGARGVVSTDYEGWTGVNGAHATPSASGVTLRYTLSEQLATRFRPRQPSDAGPLPIVASPSVASAAGTGARLPLRIGGEQIVVRIAAVARAFPGTRGDFVVADRSLLDAAVNAERPGAAVSNEVWIGVPPDRRDSVAAALRRPPFDALSVKSRSDLERSLRHDPLARGALLTLVAGAIVALALALIGIVLGVVSDLRDERGQLLDLEAQGARPATLRRIVRLRSAVIALAGLAGGIAAGAVLSRLVVDLVAVTANARAAELPLELTLDWPVLALAVGACGLFASVLVFAVTRRA